MGSGGRARRERGRRGELAACLPARSSRGRDAPHLSGSASPSKFPVPGRPDPGMATAARPPLRPFFQPPRRNLGQGRRDQTQTLALLGRSRRPPGRGAGGFQDGADTLRTNPSHKFYFPFALEVLSGSRSTPARLARLPALPRQRYESVPGEGYFGTLRKRTRFQWTQGGTLNTKTAAGLLWVLEKRTMKNPNINQSLDLPVSSIGVILSFTDLIGNFCIRVREETKMKQLLQGYALPRSVPGPKSMSGSAHPSVRPLSLLPPCTSGVGKGCPMGQGEGKPADTSGAQEAGYSLTYRKFCLGKAGRPDGGQPCPGAPYTRDVFEQPRIHPDTQWAVSDTSLHEESRERRSDLGTTPGQPPAPLLTRLPETGELQTQGVVLGSLPWPACPREELMGAK
ncbi:hypothetical protein R6Z07M_010176 [Ovis aries]